MNDSLDAEHDVNNYEESIHKFSSKNTSQRFSDKMASNRFFFLYVLFWSSEEIWNWKCNKSHGKDDNLPLLFPPMLPLSQTNKQWYYIK